MNTLRKRSPRRLVFALIALVVVFGLGIRAFYFPGRAFDSATWQDDVQVEKGVRLAMADSLVDRDGLIGKTRNEVLQMLGEQSPEPYFAQWDLRYWLGPERGFIGIDSEWLVLRFGADGRVIENSIVTD